CIRAYVLVSANNYSPCVCLSCVLQEDWVLCRVFQKRKGDGDGPQDSGGAASPTFTGSMSTTTLSQLQPPDHRRHAAAAAGGYYVGSQQLAAGYDSAAGFANPTQPAVPHYQYGGAVIGFPEEFGGGGGVADEYGFGTYLDLGFELDDTASVLGGIRSFPQGWN
ncbi:Os02g0623300, partial [Oryza sativa Japonica Group]